MADFCSQLRNNNNQGGQVLIVLFSILGMMIDAITAMYEAA